MIVGLIMVSQWTKKTILNCMIYDDYKVKKFYDPVRNHMYRDTPPKLKH